MSFEGELPSALSALKQVENGPSAPQVAPNYTKISESFRQMAPNDMLCSVFCGGRKCKYDSSDGWSDGDMAISGLYSHWITEDILAMARPNTELMNRENLVNYFHKLGIKTVINLQVHGEHAKCGPPLHESGFTYSPETLMANDIFYYNFEWRDYGVSTFEGLLDVIKVMAFALTEGKVAVHCHAGLGRTGVLISCYLMFSLRVRAQDAIRYVRLKRPGSVQTRSQIMLAQQFEQNMLPHLRVYCNKEMVPEKDKKNHHEFSFEQYLSHQTFVLHGYEARALRYIPKIVYVICERLLAICHAQEVLPPRSVSASSNITYADHQHTGRDARLMFTRADQNQFKKSPFLQDWRPGSWEPLNVRSTNNGYVRVRGVENEVILTDMAESESSGRVSPDDDQEITATDMQSWASGASGNTQRLEDLLDQHFGPDISSNAVFQELASQADTIGPNETAILTTEDVLNALLADTQLSNLPSGLANSVRRYRHELTGRASAWTRLQSERRPRLLATLLWFWLIHLKTPVLGTSELSFIVVYGSHAEKCFNKLDSGRRFTLEYLLRFVSRLTLTHAQNLNMSAKSLPLRTELLKRLASGLTKQAVVANGINYPIIPSYNKLGKGTLSKMLEFFEYMLEWIEGSTPAILPLPKAVSISAPSTPVVPPTAPLPVAAESTSFAPPVNLMPQASTSYSISVPSSGSGSPALSISPPNSGPQTRTPIPNSARVGGNVRPSGRPSVPASAKHVKVLTTKEGRSVSSPTLTMPIHEGVP